MNDNLLFELDCLQKESSFKRERSSQESPYPKFKVFYKVGDIEKDSTVSAKSVDLAKRMIYISESSKGNIDVKIIRVVML